MLPTAPPVTMIGPSAPNGPPVPMLTALEIGLSTASRGSMRLPRSRIVSIASGMPWPRIRSEPIARHHPHDQPADDRHQHAERPEDAVVGTCRARGERAGVGEVRDQRDQVEQPKRQQRDGGADQQREPGQHEDRSRNREVAELTRVVAKEPRPRRRNCLRQQPL